MKALLLKITNFLKNNLPLFIVVVIALTVSLKNIIPNTFFSGWDNIHAELNLLRYTKQILTGAWLEYQGLGAPAAQGHLSEIFRLPFLWILSFLFPTNLIRYVYIFSLYIAGGVTMYFYLSKVWLDQKKQLQAQWFACLGSILYLLHILTLQQFHIAFEMFMVQFAFLPLLLLVIHRFKSKLTIKTTLLFFLTQFLLAPSAHTSTVFYLGVLFSLLYCFFINLKFGLTESLKKFLFVGFLTFLFNAYWILPNLYYSFYNSNYVHESHDNQIFAPESIASVSEAGTFSNFLKGTQYLFTWRDYSFENKQFEFIFSEWENHLNSPLVSFLLIIIGLMTIAGAFALFFSHKKGYKRFAILITYFICVSFIWMGLLPTGLIFNLFYKFGSFTEVFRNPFTKLSIIYSIVSVILFIYFWESFFNFLRRKKYIFKINKVLLIILPIVMAGGIIYTALPSFHGHFLNEKLRIKYPVQYQQLFNYLNTRNKNLRILSLPQLGHAGWEYYDWQFLGDDNGYQGIGFYFFGINQPVLHRDFDRWIESSDFFYYELKYALDSNNLQLFENVIEKYNVDLILIDETRVDTYQEVNFTSQHQLAEEAEFSKVWSQDFLTLYERKSSSAESELIVPNQVSLISAEAERVTVDNAYAEYKDYVLTDSNEAILVYPFANLAKKEILNIDYSSDSTSVTAQIPTGNYTLTIPSFILNKQTPAVISYKNNLITFDFPQYQLTLNEKLINLPSLEDQQFNTNQAFDSLLIILDNKAIAVNQGEIIYSAINLDSAVPIKVSYASNSEQTNFATDGVIEGTNLEIYPIGYLNFNPELFKETIFLTQGSDEVTLSVNFPIHPLNISQNPSVNCGFNQLGSIETKEGTGVIIFSADNFGVNCNGFIVDSEDSSQDYLLRVSGQNLKGRGIKFFINHKNSDALSDDYIFSDKNFDETLNLHAISSGANYSPILLNWETRSFGKQNLTKLFNMSLSYFPLSKAAAIKLNLEEFLGQIDNQLYVKEFKSYLDTVKVADVSCEADQCWLGLDQTYDQAWLAINFKTGKILEHGRYNTWANVWSVNSGENKILIIYLPNLLSSSCLFLLLAWMLYFVYKTHFFSKIKKTDDF